MRSRYLATAVAALFLAAACAGPGSGGSPGTSPGGGSPGTSPTGGAGGFDPAAVSGTVVLSGWKASPEEGAALQKVLDGFATKYPNIKVDYQPSEDYDTQMLARFSSKEPPDLFYMDSSKAPEWIDQGVIQELDTWASERGFDTGQFYESYLNAFKGTDGKVYGYPKDGNTLAMAYNTDMLEKAGVKPPTTLDELTAAAEKLTTGGVKGVCLNNGLDRAGAFIYAYGGGILSDDKKSSEFTSDKTKEAVGWYLDFFAKGWGARAKEDMGVDWCGQALGEKKAAIIFEGGWLDPYMKSNFADTKYAWAPMPKGAEQATLGFTVSYSIGVDSKNKDAAWVLLTYLTGPEGMKTWTEGGVANPSRKDVPAVAGKEILVDGAAYARPWSFIPGFSKAIDAFGNAMTAAIEAKSASPDDVIAKTEAAIQQALSGQ